jgi:hypothetical protein
MDMNKHPRRITLRKSSQLKWAVFNIETKFRLTEYDIRSRAINAIQSILYDQPELKGKIAVKQRNFEKKLINFL